MLDVVILFIGLSYLSYYIYYNNNNNITMKCLLLNDTHILQDHYYNLYMSININEIVDKKKNGTFLIKLLLNNETLCNIMYDSTTGFLLSQPLSCNYVKIDKQYINIYPDNDVIEFTNDDMLEAIVKRIY